MLLKLGSIVALAVEAVIVGVAWNFTDILVGIFNSEGNETLLYLAHDGLRLYFLGYLFAGINILLVSYFAATARVKQAFVASVLRGALAIAVCAVVMAKLWGIHGVWLSFLVSEILTLSVIFIMSRTQNQGMQKQAA